MPEKCRAAGQLGQLRKSLPAHESYISPMYFRSADNPADDGTRGRELRAPSRDKPEWLASAIDHGSLAALDAWPEKEGALPSQALGLPPLSELV